MSSFCEEFEGHGSLLLLTKSLCSIKKMFTSLYSLQLYVLRLADNKMQLFLLITSNSVKVVLGCLLKKKNNILAWTPKVSYVFGVVESHLTSLYLARGTPQIGAEIINRLVDGILKKCKEKEGNEIFHLLVHIY